MSRLQYSHKMALLYGGTHTHIHESGPPAAPAGSPEVSRLCVAEVKGLTKESRVFGDVGGNPVNYKKSKIFIVYE